MSSFSSRTGVINQFICKSVRLQSWLSVQLWSIKQGTMEIEEMTDS
jgi:hypothetical protein